MANSILQELAQSMAARPSPQRIALSDAGTLQHLRDHLFAQVDPLLDGPPPSSLWVLISPQITDQLANARRRNEAVPLPIEPDIMRPEQRPYLLPLGDFGRDDTIDFTLDLAWAEATRHPDRETRGSSVCAWLVFPAEQARHVAHGMAMQARHRWPGSHARYLRLWDPRVFELLTDLGDAEPPVRYAPATNGVWWLNRAGALQRCPAPAPAPSTPLAEATWPEAAKAMLRNSGTINAVLNALQDAEHNVVQPPLAAAILSLAERASSTWGLTNELDRIIYALYGVLISPQFDQDTTVREAMLAARAQGDSPIAALAGFDAAFWERHSHA
ncbi:hypothetical protein N5J06_07240 [Ralstonia sp. CHL-2022]|uniref:DUF4123 domain-containing protein n=1 Tax=Ralstonia mojiangensis TaxID=2953895 RepID=A0ABT2L5S1_9RALS|nr:hypothetical protein [Ralstonia mojiangensis]MCT7296292.1 hypothetical protein [Ralstonia mojiangensis]MCT7310735.1 hypothetical protein [Ralstonia mojiangensis]